MFRKLPIILMVLITSIFALSPSIPLEVKQNLYAISLTVKSLILTLLPMIIFSLLFSTIVGLQRDATKIITLILLAVCCSNLTSTFLSHYVGNFVYHSDIGLITPRESLSLSPAWLLEFPRLLANDQAMFLGIVSALIMGKWKPHIAHIIAQRLNWVISKTLPSFAIFIVLFIAGFVIKMQYDGTIHTILHDYVHIFLIVILVQFGYIFFLYGLVNQFNLTAWKNCIKNILPAAMAGFGTMSSAAVMPLTIVGAEANAKNKTLARSIIPATVNIHLIGDCIAIPIFAYAVMKSFGFAEPSLTTYLLFTGYFVMAKFSVAAIPGGGIMVMLPILESCLGFNGEMLSLMTALYILFDPVITSANILGNGMFAKFIDKIATLIQNNKRAEQTETP